MAPIRLRVFAQSALGNFIAFVFLANTANVGGVSIDWLGRSLLWDLSTELFHHFKILRPAIDEEPGRGWTYCIELLQNRFSLFSAAIKN